MDTIITGVLIGLAAATAITMLVVGSVAVAEMLTDLFLKVHDDDDN